MKLADSKLFHVVGKMGDVKALPAFGREGPKEGVHSRWQTTLLNGLDILINRICQFLQI